jgi:hypothetical protein
MCNEIMASLGVKKKVKYVNTSAERKDDRPKELHLVDWSKTLLKKNIAISSVFNHSEDPRCLTVEQIPYCINLLRYCEKEFSKGKKLRQMFKKSFDTLESIYEEMGLKRLFELIVKDFDDITVQICMKLLVRCQFMLRFRTRMIGILELIDDREDMLKQLNFDLVEHRILDRIKI